jgi:dihydropteroate synthase
VTARAGREHPVWRVRGGDIVVDKPIVFGILNVTPDSFSDGGLFDTTEAALRHVEAMVGQRADGVDVGGESTRPQGATLVSADEELRRVVPVVREIRARFPDLVMSVDTTKSAVAEAVLSEGVNIINDVSGLRLDPRLGEIVATGEAGLVLMHSRGGVAEMGTYRHADYGADVVGDMIGELAMSVQYAETAGVQRSRIVLDPGVGFAKQSEHSLRVLAELRRVVALGLPVMVGVSRKRFVGELSGVNRPEERVAGTVGANVAALMLGARLFRVHDVAPNRQALDVAWAVMQGGASALETRRPDSRFPIPDSRA